MNSDRPNHPSAETGVPDLASRPGPTPTSLHAPSHAILGWAKLLRQGDLSDESRERAVIGIERSVLRQTQLIEMLADLGRAAAGKLALEKTVVDLAEFVETGVDEARPEAERKNIALATDLGRSVEVAADPVRLRQMVAALLAQAIQETPPGGRIDVRVERRERLGSLSVLESGRGTARGLPFVFEWFRGSTGTLAEPRGFSLLLVRKLVELHGGTLWVESQGRGKGARLTVSLPLAKEPATKE